MDHDDVTSAVSDDLDEFCTDEKKYVNVDATCTINMHMTIVLDVVITMPTRVLPPFTFDTDSDCYIYATDVETPNDWGSKNDFCVY